MATTITDTLATDTDITTANTFVTVGTVTLTAGTWLVVGTATVRRTTTTGAVFTARINDGTTDMSGTQVGALQTSTTTTGSSCLTVVDIITVTDPLDVTLQVASTVGGSATKVLATPSSNGTDLNATQLRAILL